MATSQTTVQPSVVRTDKLVSTVSTASTTLVDRFSDILEIASLGNKDKYITAAETYQIDVHAAAMVRAAEDLLGVTRKLKQLWILSEARQDADEEPNAVDARLQVNDIARKLRRILQKEGLVEEEEMDEVQLAKTEPSEDVIEID